jgi:hypothetical protein
MRRKLTLAATVFILFAAAADAQELGSPCNYSRMNLIIVTHADVPLYPALAVQAHVGGTVDIRISVKGGAIVSADPVPGTNPMLAASAKVNLMSWQFASTGYGDFCVRYVYELDKEEGVGPSNSRVEMKFPDRVKIMATPSKPSCNDCALE